MKNGIKTLAMWLIIGVIFIVVLSSIVENSDSKLKYSELIADINSGKVESIQIEADGKTATVQLKDDKVKKEVNIPDMGSFMTYTEEFLKEGAFTLDDKVKDLDSRFKNVGDLTMRDVLTFNAHFDTAGRLSDQRTIEEAKDCLYNMKGAPAGKHDYNDMGMMLTKEVMENVTGKSYQELVDYYIVDKLGLKDTHLVLPKNKIERFTGSANFAVGMVNDPSALAVGGYSGHAGIKTTSDDLISLGDGVLTGKILPSEMLSDAYTPGIKANRGIMGNTYTSHEQGTAKTYVSRLAPKKAFAVQGSTRNNVVMGPDSISTILVSSCAMGLERAKEEEAKVNAKRAEEGKSPLSLVKEFTYVRDGREVHYNLVDVREMLPSGATVERIINKNAELSLKLNFLNTVIKAYDSHYNQPVNVVANGKTFQK